MQNVTEFVREIWPSLTRISDGDCDSLEKVLQNHDVCGNRRCQVSSIILKAPHATVFCGAVAPRPEGRENQKNSLRFPRPRTLENGWCFIITSFPLILLERHRRLSREWNPKGTSISEEMPNLVGGADQNPLQLKCVPLFRYT